MGFTYGLYPTELGWIGILGSDRGLRRLILPQPSAQKAFYLLNADAEHTLHNPLQYLALSRRLKRYFSGQVVDFSRETPDFAGASPFRKAVWETVRTIPFGETRSYKWVAEKLGKPGCARAAGQALGANPLPIIIPCHRVVGIRDLGGYSGGRELKQKLLELETSLPARTGRDACATES